MDAPLTDELACRAEADGAVVRCDVVGGQELVEFGLGFSQTGVDAAYFGPGHYFCLGAQGMEGKEVRRLEGPEDEPFCEDGLPEAVGGQGSDGEGGPCETCW